MMVGGHTMARCAEATEAVLRGVFAQLVVQGVALDAMILKPNMVLPGLASREQPTAGEVAQATVRVLRRAVPAEVPGIAFLSGGQSGELASARLNAINSPVASPSVAAPWALTFSCARAIQRPALQIWAGKDANDRWRRGAHHRTPDSARSDDRHDRGGRHMRPRLAIG